LDFTRIYYLEDSISAGLKRQAEVSRRK